jgi:hypothetical protein
MANSSKTKSSAKDGRKDQLEQIQGIIIALKERLKSSYDSSKKLSLLTSVAVGLYEETDKLSKKAPAERVTDLMLEQVNDVIRETKELITDDTYVQRLNEFVAAGDNPELRDVLVVLRQLRQGMQRYEQGLSGFQRRALAKITEARTVATALEYNLSTNDPIAKSYVEGLLGNINEDWFKYSSAYGKEIFNMEKLDHIDISEHFDAD